MQVPLRLFALTAVVPLFACGTGNEDAPADAGEVADAGVAPSSSHRPSSSPPFASSSSSSSGGASARAGSSSRRPASSSSANACAGVTCSGVGTCGTAGGAPACDCRAGYHAVGLSCVVNSPCDGVTCSGHGTCQVQMFSNTASCQCASGYRAVGTECVSEANPCSGQACSGHGTCRAWRGEPVCACQAGYTPSSTQGLDCVPTSQVCTGGSIHFDVDGDGTVDTTFTPSAEECAMYELINFTRATHDDEGTDECHGPLAYDLEWSAHGRNHSMLCAQRGGLFHADYPRGQNCAYGCDAACEMNLYMTGANEGHCPAYSHHCNIMRCGFSSVGIGTYGGSWNTQNFQ